MQVLGGRYRLGAVLAADGPAVTHRSFDTLLGRDVAVRVCRAAPAELAQQRAAAKRTAALAHHGLVPVIDLVDDPDGRGDALAVVTELPDGPTLHAALAARGPMTSRQAAYLGFDLAEAFEYLHAHGLAGGGIAADAVLLSPDGDEQTRARLTDLTGMRVADAAGCAHDVAAVARTVIAALGGTGDRPPAGTPAPLAAVLGAALAGEEGARPTAGALAVEFRAVIAGEFGRHRRVRPESATDQAEEARLDALHRYDLLDTPPEGAFDRITRLAARALDMPVATVSIVDRDRIWFKSRLGLEGDETGRDPGLCAAVVATGERVHVPDARADPSTRDNPLIAGDAALRSYTGVPLTTVDGYTLGALSVADYRPRPLTADQLDLLEQLGSLVTHELEMRVAVRRAVLSRA